jgi:hypothetical protein
MTKKKATNAKASTKSRTKPIRKASTPEVVAKLVKTHRFKILGLAALACGFYLL